MHRYSGLPARSLIRIGPLAEDGVDQRPEIIIKVPSNECSGRSVNR